MLTIYGIASCDTCRKAKRWLEQHGIEYENHDLRQDGLDIQTLERWSEHVDWETLLNRSSATWRRLPEVDRADMGRNSAFASMIEHPTLVKRPVLEGSRFVAVGFTPEQYRALFAKKR